MMIKRISHIGFLLLAVLTLMTGCKTVDFIDRKDTDPKAHMTPTEAKHDVQGELDAAQNALGGTWENMDSPIAEGCAVPADSGFYYTAARNQLAPVTDYDGPASRLFDFWTKRGYAVETKNFSSTHRSVSTTTATGAKLVFRVEHDGLRLRAEGPCVEGNWGKVRQADALEAERREAATPTPTPTPTADR